MHFLFVTSRNSNTSWLCLMQMNKLVAKISWIARLLCQRLLVNIYTFQNKTVVILQIIFSNTFSSTKCLEFAMCALLSSRQQIIIGFDNGLVGTKKSLMLSCDDLAHRLVHAWPVLFQCRHMSIMVMVFQITGITNCEDRSQLDSLTKAY